MKSIFYFILILATVECMAFSWQGHRGARGLFPENTVLAMKEALKFPITTLEMDVIVSKDKKVVVSHEPWMSEEICLTPKGKTVKDREYNLYKMNYSEIKKFDCGSKAHPRFAQQKKIKTIKPLLSELLSKLKSSKKDFNIEIKSTVEDERDGFQPDYKTMTDLVMTEIKKYLKPDQVTIQSFDWRVLQYLHEKYSDFRLVALRETAFKPEDVVKELGFKPAIFSPSYDMLSKTVVDYFHKENILVIPWTVNNQQHMDELKNIGVDGIITDYPNLIKQ